MKHIKRIILIFILVVIAYFSLALALSIISTNPKTFNCTNKKKIFISTNGIHLDIIIAKKDLPIKIQQELELHSNVNYASFGWGDKGFYLETPTWDDLKFSTAIKALFLNSETAVHLTKYNKKYSNWQSILICEEQLTNLINYINSSFSRDSEGQIVEISNSGYTSFDTFYEANGSYNCLKTCNNWVNSGLKKAAIKTSIWSPFDKGVLYHIEK